MSEKTTYKVRASSLPMAFDCPARWAAIHLEGMTSANSSRSHFGTCIHASTGAFDAGRMHGEGFSADDTAGVFVDTLRQPEYDVDWGDDRVQDLENIGLKLHTEYCTRWSPQNTFTGVEVACDSLDVDCGEIIIRLTGTTDRIRVAGDNGRKGIGDLKSGGAAVSPDGTARTKGHGLQMAVYELLAEEATGELMELPAQITGLQVSKSNPRVGVGSISAARKALLGTDEQPGALHALAGMLKSGVFPGNPRSMLCSNRYCPAWKTCFWREWSGADDA